MMKKYNSITNSMRHVILLDNSHLSKNKSLKTLLKIKKKFSGRNNSGKINVFSKSSKNQSKTFYRLIDYKRINNNIPGMVFRFEYDPNRSSFISLIRYFNNVYCYILGIKNTNLGDIIQSYNYDIFNKNIFNYKKGDNNSLIYLVKGSIINNLETVPSFGSKYIRSAGTYGVLLSKYYNINKALIELPSKIKIYVSIYNKATIGIICNEHYKHISLGKAGRNRWLGKKPSVRGVAQNPVDHPHGGGEGKKNNPASKKNPWGKTLKWKSITKKNVLYT